MKPLGVGCVRSWRHLCFLITPFTFAELCCEWNFLGFLFEIVLLPCCSFTSVCGSSAFWEVWLTFSLIYKSSQTLLHVLHWFHAAWDVQPAAPLLSPSSSSSSSSLRAGARGWTQTTRSHPAITATSSSSVTAPTVDSPVFPLQQAVPWVLIFPLIK